MTDEFPRPGGGDGDGPAETPTERLLREAMNARASMVTAHGLRPAAPPKSRVRRLRPLYLTTAPILALAASLAIGVLAFHGDPVAKQDVPPPPAADLTASPSPTATPSTTPSPTATPTGTGTPTDDAETDTPLADVSPSTTRTATGAPTGAASSYSFRGVKFKVPAGWKAVQVTDRGVCVLSPGAPADPQQNWSTSMCAPYGVLLVAYNSSDELKGGAWPMMGDLESLDGWSHQGACPVWGNPHTPGAQEVNSSDPDRTFPTVAGRSANKSQWQASCGKDSFTAQIWALPKDQVFVAAAGLKDDYQAGLTSIVNSLDVSGHQAPPVSPEASSDDIAVSYDGLADGQKVLAGGPVVTFSVIYRNTGHSTYSQLEPLVVTDHYPGSPPAQVVWTGNDGTLERQDGGTWKQVAMSPGSDMGYAVADPASLFSLAPGQSKKVTYRLTVGAGNGPGDMPVKAQVMLPYSGSKLTVLGEKDITVKIAK
ncbi:hypothetical protein ACGF07_10455 [Kitasatospora sp. NPDC048194]|uniref:hypothetical protein n=1 Tax=Kitasatospora sp. NPDC048194 TaxID=3364045 RepID=UPI003720A17F